MSEIRIRAATLADAEAIARVHVQAWRETYRGLLPDDVLANLSVEARTARWRNALGDPQQPVIRVAEGEAILGFAAAGKPFNEKLAAEVEVWSFYLLDAIKRRGIGRKLFAELTAALVGRGVSSTGLWVLEGNTPARRFYEAMGGRQDVSRPDIVGGLEVIDVAYVWDDLAAFSERSRS